MDSDIKLTLPADFYPRPPRGGRLNPLLRLWAAEVFLSTPSARRATLMALPSLSRMAYFYPRPPRGGRRFSQRISFRQRLFLSTPSARRATKRGEDGRVVLDISIHALREEGDVRCKNLILGQQISIHALREEGDMQLWITHNGEREFLSTPSARRATAKTETKSLFSNKLYNILHEFRRALIYNGSKSYPNHAK